MPRDTRQNDPPTHDELERAREQALDEQRRDERRSSEIRSVIRQVIREKLDSIRGRYR